MDVGEKTTALENQIYNAAVGILQEAEIPSTVGRLIMDGVYRRFVESAYYVALQRMELLEKELIAGQRSEKKETPKTTAETPEMESVKKCRK